MQTGDLLTKDKLIQILGSAADKKAEYDKALDEVPHNVDYLGGEEDNLPTGTDDPRVPGLLIYIQMIIPLTKSEMRKRLRHTSEINQYNLAFNTVVQKTFVLFCIFDSLRTSIEKNEEKNDIFRFYSCSN